MAKKKTITTKLNLRQVGSLRQLQNELAQAEALRADVQNRIMQYVQAALDYNSRINVPDGYMMKIDLPNAQLVFNPPKDDPKKDGGE